MRIPSHADAPATMASKSLGYRCASVMAWRPPVEQPLKNEIFGALP